MKIKQTYWNKDSARAFVMNLLRERGYKEVRNAHTNRFGHTLIRTMIPDVNKEQNFYYLFKKYEFRAFNNVFKHYSKQKNAILGTGESINKEYLAFAMKKKCKLLFCKRDEPRAIYTPDRNMLKTLQNIRHPKAIYTGVLTVNILKDFCEDNGLIRVQDKTNEYKTNDYTDATILVNEETYSFPDKLLMRYDDVQTKLTKVVA